MVHSCVVVAMSGGVDSAVTAALMKEEGCQVIGATLRLTTKENSGYSCPSGEEIADARKIAKKLGILHYVLDCELLFRSRVITPFIESYTHGETPVPCVLCNKLVKLHMLLSFVFLFRAESLATGHYVRKRDGQNGPELWQSRDQARDQSYFLFAITRKQLGFLKFPVGELVDKTVVRSYARCFNLPVSTKRDSQDLCFIPNNSHYGQFISTVQPKGNQLGDIVHVEDGRVLGQHPGIFFYTVGQRRGLNIRNSKEPLYVVRLEPNTRRVVVGPYSALAQRQFTVRNINWLGSGTAPLANGQMLTVRLRSTHLPVPAIVYGRMNNSALVLLAQPFMGITPGQACVFYQNEQVLGGGWICKAI